MGRAIWESSTHTIKGKAKNPKGADREEDPGLVLSDL